MNNSIRLTLLVNNEGKSGLIAEHGFAAWIEVAEQRILFDTGQGAALAANAHSLEIDLSKATALVLSHGHYDHSGGLPDFLAANSHAPLYFGAGLATPRFSCHPDQAPRAIGIGERVAREIGELPSGRRKEITAPYYLAPGVGISGPIPRHTSFEDTGGPFFLDAEKACPDSLGDELSMWFETSEGLVILTGCCHAGLVNTVDYVRKISGVERVHGIIGGLHLLQASEDRLQKTEECLAEWMPDFLIPCHCTGSQVAERLLRVFGAAHVQPGLAGESHNLGEVRGGQKML